MATPTMKDSEKYQNRIELLQGNVGYAGSVGNPTTTDARLWHRADYSKQIKRSVVGRNRVSLSSAAPPGAVKVGEVGVEGD